MTVHPDMTALRAVDACGGIYTPAEEASGFAAGHRAALGSAMVSVRPVDGLMAELLEALSDLELEITHASEAEDFNLVSVKTLNAALAVIAKATGSEAA